MNRALSPKEEVVFTEAVLSVNEFNRPKVLYNNDAIAQMLINIAMLDPDTYPDHPGMGLGLVKNYRYTFTKDVEKIKEAFKEQIEKYLYWFDEVDVNISASNSELRFIIKLNTMTYRLLLDIDKKTLRSL